MASIHNGKVPLDELTDLAENLGPARSHESGLTTLVVDRLLAGGKTDQAAAYLRDAAEASPTGEEHVRLGELAADQKNWPEAARDFRLAWDKDPTRAVPLYFQGWALSQGPDAAQGRQLMDRAELLPLGDETERYALALAMDQHGLSEGATRQRQWIIDNGVIGSRTANRAAAGAAVAAWDRGDYPATARFAERAMIDLPRPELGIDEAALYLQATALVARARAMVALTGPDLPAALALIDQCRDLSADEIDVVIAAVPILRKMGKGSEADALLAKAAAPLEAACTKYDGSALLHNNFAWLLAKCHRRLDDALHHAQRAVELAPANTDYIDTLAEAQFQMGHRPEAVALLQKCITMEPQQPRHRQRLSEFQTAALPAD
jgi:tetratricopeptide (TPR) repeat protein